MRNGLTFSSALLLAPLAYAFHHYEEHMVFSFRDWRLLYFPDNNPATTELVFIVITSVTLIYIFLHLLLQNRATAQSVVLFLLASQVHNAVFHTGGTIVYADFSPGLYTAVLLYIPVNILIAYKALQEGFLTWKSLGVLFVLGGFMFWSFEFVGPVVMLVAVALTYTWIGYTAYSDRHRRNQTVAASAISNE